MSCTSGLTSKSHVPELRVAGLRCLFIGWLMLAGGCLHEAAAQTGGAIDRGRLSQAVALDDVRTVRAQVEARAIGVNDPISGIGYDATPMLTVTARHASLNVLRYLIAAKADLNVRTPDNDTAAMLAAFFGEEERERMTTSTERHDQALRILIEAGAPLENIADAYTPLAYVAYAGRENAVRYLLEKGARVDAGAQGRSTRVNTPLIMATLQGHRNVVRQLLRAGADAGVRVAGGSTAAELAQKYNQSRLLPLLRCAESLAPGEFFGKRCE